MRNTDGTFQKGTSGNPSGRPASVARRLRMLDSLTTDEALARVWNAVIEAAVAGDIAAAKLILDRVLGPTASLGDLEIATATLDWRALLLRLDPIELKKLETRLEPADNSGR